MSKNFGMMDCFLFVVKLFRTLTLSHRPVSSPWHLFLHCCRVGLADLYLFVFFVGWLAGCLCGVIVLGLVTSIRQCSSNACNPLVSVVVDELQVMLYRCLLDRLYLVCFVPASGSPSVLFIFLALTLSFPGAGSAVGLHLRSILYLLERAVGADVAPDTKLE